ncbi:hypothetical protein WJX73_000470 [Symbiochloris irregularis]|uniref:Exostosin GT47 domain-containing protein n=1 Tax=Symbiochloris irregularis TaxID=706552 RepID=A0AAW1NV03_9CHLO
MNSLVVWGVLATVAVIGFLVVDMSPAGPTAQTFIRARARISASANSFEASDIQAVKLQSHLRTCNIYILDVVEEYGLGSCNVSEEVVAVRGALYRKDDARWTELQSPHYTSQHAGPYWLKKHIEASSFRAKSVEEADAVFVYDYCLMMRWLTAMHSPTPPWSSPENPLTDPMLELGHAYRTMMATPRFQESGGRDLAMFFPHPLLYVPVQQEHCGSTHEALKLVVEAAEVKICADPAVKANGLIVPYASPEFIEDDEEQAPERTTFMFFLGSCEAPPSNLGKAMRKRIGTLNSTLPADSTSLISCSLRMAHSELRKQTRSSQFCLLPPGDTASSRRITDIILAGCIPVFIGRPWHSMPLAGFVNYRDLAVFIEVSELIHLAQDPHTWRDISPNSTATNVFAPQFWFPDAHAYDDMIKIDFVEDIEPTLKAIPQEEVERKLKAVAAARSYFLYRKPAPPHPPLEGPNAADAIVDAICTHAKPLAGKLAKSSHLVMDKPHEHSAHASARLLREGDVAADVRRLLEEY